MIMTLVGAKDLLIDMYIFYTMTANNPGTGVFCIPSDDGTGNSFCMPYGLASGEACGQNAAAVSFLHVMFH